MFNECTKILTSGGVCSANLSFEEENEKLSNGSRAGDKAKTLPYSGSPSLLLKIMLKEPETKKAGKHVRIRTTITLRPLNYCTGERGRVTRVLQFLPLVWYTINDSPFHFILILMQNMDFFVKNSWW